MKSQEDRPVRIVALENLRAMCSAASGIASYRYAVTRVTRHRVYVTCSDIPHFDGAGYRRPRRSAVAAFPAFPLYGEADNPRVVLEPLLVRPDSEEDVFYRLIEYPVLYRAFDGRWDREDAFNGEP